MDFNDGTANFYSRNEALTLGNPPLAVELFGPSAASAATAAAKKGR